MRRSQGMRAPRRHELCLRSGPIMSGSASSAQLSACYTECGLLRGLLTYLACARTCLQTLTLAVEEYAQLTGTVLKGEQAGPQSMCPRR